MIRSFALSLPALSSLVVLIIESIFVIKPLAHIFSEIVTLPSLHPFASHDSDFINSFIFYSSLAKINTSYRQLLVKLPVFAVFMVIVIATVLKI